MKFFGNFCIKMTDYNIVKWLNEALGKGDNMSFFEEIMNFLGFGNQENQDDAVREQLENDMHQNDNGDPIDDRQNHLPVDLGRGDRLETCRNCRIEFLGQLLGHRAENLHGAEGIDKRRKLSVRHQRPVQMTENISDADQDNDRQSISKRSGQPDLEKQAEIRLDEVQQDRAQAAQHGPNGKVDPAGDNDETHPQRDDARVSVVPQDVQPGHTHFREQPGKGTGVIPHDHALDQNHHQQREQC